MKTYKMPILSSRLRNAINKRANGMDLTFTFKNININGDKRGCSGFVRNNANGTVVYVNTEATPRANLHYMYRYADSEKDYTGYNNRWAYTLEELATEICHLLKHTIQEQGAREVYNEFKKMVGVADYMSEDGIKRYISDETFELLKAHGFIEACGVIDDTKIYAL